MILEYILLSPAERATCKYWKEDIEDKISVMHSLWFIWWLQKIWWGTVVESREPSKIRAHILRRKGNTNAWRMELPSPFGWKLQNSFPRGKVAAGKRTLYSTGIMDANNFNILWTEVSWDGNKTLTAHSSLNQGNCLYLEWTPSDTHNNSTEREMNQYFCFRPEKTSKQKPASQQLALETHGVSSVLLQGGWLTGPQWKLVGNRVAVRTLVRLLRNQSVVFLF